MSHTIEQDWITRAGLRAVVLRVTDRFMDHRCGYVGVPPGHQHFGKHYDEVDADVHGGLTYGDGSTKYPVASNLCWYGYDCAHLDDTPANCDLAYCVVECESLAKQLMETK